jgi:site-specific DNA recombinase
VCAWCQSPQELGDELVSNMIRQIMALFDEYQTKENAKHTLRAMKKDARQGFWNKKTLEIDPILAEAVRLTFRLAHEADGSSGPMDV